MGSHLGRISKKLFVLAVVLFSIIHLVTSDCAENSIYCYECDSYTDERCKDPFNTTLLPKELPPLNLCNGCCVKIVKNYNTSDELVQRTCTKELGLTIILNEDVCTTNDERGERTCFCPQDLCNSAHFETRPAIFLFLTPLAFLLN